MLPSSGAHCQSVRAGSLPGVPAHVDCYVMDRYKVNKLRPQSQSHPWASTAWKGTRSPASHMRLGSPMDSHLMAEAG